MTNMVSFDKDKFKQALHYIAYKIGSMDNVGKTILYKVMYFSDFDFYELNNKSITGETYYKLPHGPAPCNFDSCVNELKGEGKIKEINSSFGGFLQKKIISVCEPSLGLLNGDEIKVIDKVINKLSGMSANQVSAYSHGDIPWKATDDKKEINYDLVFYRNDTYSVKEPIVCSVD